MILLLILRATRTRIPVLPPRLDRVPHLADVVRRPLDATAVTEACLARLPAEEGTRIAGPLPLNGTTEMIDHPLPFAGGMMIAGVRPGGDTTMIAMDETPANADMIADRLLRGVGMTIPPRPLGGGRLRGMSGSSKRTAMIGVGATATVGDEGDSMRIVDHAAIGTH